MSKTVLIFIIYILITWPIAAWLFLRKRAYSKHVRGTITKLDSRIRCKKLKPCTIHYTYTVDNRTYQRTETIKPSNLFDRICIIGPVCHTKLVEGAGISVYVNPMNPNDARLYHNNDDYRLTGGLLVFSSVAFVLGIGPYVNINTPKFRGGFGTITRRKPANFIQTQTQT